MCGGAQGAGVTAEPEGSTYAVPWDGQSHRIYVGLKAEQRGLSSDFSPGF